MPDARDREIADLKARLSTLEGSTASTQPTLRPVKKKATGRQIFLAVAGFLFVGALVSSLDHASSPSSDTTNAVTAPEDAANIEAGRQIIARQYAEKVIRASLKDPDSARFGQEFYRAGKAPNAIVCGYVNAKNSFGGYGGEEPFIVVGSMAELGESGDQSRSFSHSWNALCVDDRKTVPHRRHSE